MHNPDVVISLGDSGTAWSKPELQDLTQKVKFLTIYGNHDNARLLSEIRNQDGTPVHVNDGEIKNIGGLRFGFINGIVATTSRPPLEKTREKFIEIGERLNWEGIDVLCTHESPANGETRYCEGARTMKDLLMSMDHALSLSGHIRSKSHVRQIINKAMNLTLDSSQRTKYYAVFNIPDGKVTLWLDKMQIGGGVDVNSFVGRATIATPKVYQKTPHPVEAEVLQIANRSDEHKVVIDTTEGAKLQEITTLDSIEETIKNEVRKETMKRTTLKEIWVDRETTLQERIKEHAKERLSDLLRIRDGTATAVVVSKGKGILDKIKK